MRLLALGILLSSSAALAEPSASAPAPAAPAPAPTAQAPATATPATPRGNGLSLVLVEELPQACRDLGKLADSPSPNQALSARISLAGCIVDQAMRSLVLCDCEQSINEINAASAQSITLLDEVFAVGDPATKILARQALGDMLSSFATRMLATVPAPIDVTASAIELRELRLQLLRPLLQPWITRANTAYTELDTIARANPQLAKNPAVLTAVRTSRAKLQAQQPGQVVTR